MSTENKKEPLLFFNESRVGLPPKWNALKIAEASIPLVVALNLPDDHWYEIKLSVKKRPEETMLCRFVGVNVLSEDPFANENFYPVFKLNSSDSCRWTLDDDESIWKTECGDGFYLDIDSPESRGMKCCCFCGKTIIS